MTLEVTNSTMGCPMASLRYDETPARAAECLRQALPLMTRQQTRPHPITGEPVPWSLMRTGHHCGMLTGCDSGMILFRSGSWPGRSA